MKNLVKKALADLPGNAPGAREKIIRELGSHIPAEDSVHFDEAVFESTAETHWQLAKKRGNGEPRITVSQANMRGHMKTFVNVVSDDMAFLVDSIGAEINKRIYLIDILVHPILYAKYDAQGNLVDLTSERKQGYTRQSHIHVQIRNILSEEAQEDLKKGLIEALRDVYTTNRDWKKMLDALQAARGELAKTAPRTDHDIEHYCAFLDYLANNNFTLLGYREYEFTEKDGEIKSKTLKGRSLGLLHDEQKPAYINDHDEGLPRNLQKLRRDLPPVSISKTNRLSTVHRRVPMDAIAIKTYDSRGKVKGEKLFLGLFTSVTYSRSVGDVPYLREKVDEVMGLSNFLPGSHNSKALRHILEKYPRDEIFQISTEELSRICLDILRLQERQRIALFMRHDSFGRYISCLVYIPRDRFGTGLRKRITKILEEELKGTCTNFYTNMDDSVFARVMFTINISQKDPPQYKPSEIEEKISEEGQTWEERLAMALSETSLKDEETARLTLKYSEAFPVAYMARYRARQAIFDIHKIEETLQTGRLILDLYRSQEEDAHHLRLKVYNPDKPLNLSDVLPILENMDLRAVAELPFEVKPAGTDKTIWIHDFLLETQIPETATAIRDAKTYFEEAFGKVWYREMESDGLNRLILRSRLQWREVTILRTYVRFLRQIGSPYSRTYIEAALIDNPRIGALLVDLFRALLDPERAGKDKNKGKDIIDSFTLLNQEMEKVESLDQDRILRSIAAMVDATVRTNFFQPNEDGSPKPYLSIKLDSRKIPDMPEPRPFREIFVYSPRVEGVHLRGDKIARGGIRWSDRHEDFRTEVLGLMKAQMVKNAVIVPMGAKGGFVVKTPIRDRKLWLAEGIECYRILVRGLLDITDNLNGIRVIPPKNVVRRDGDDPYLVVAADKGTASFSDIANALSREYKFWLDDAFASGGSAGYDHKKMGITARGAWECIKLHFRQLNHDIQKKPFDVVGIGDMAGDVFGNGMLLSEHTKLIGAFNHVHIFCDPDPDTASSFKERKRLFDNVLGWDQYDAKKLSKGGRIFSRSEKTLALTPEIQKRFDLKKDKVAPSELIQAMLRARTDLLYFGGIGTYVKASTQTHADVGDKTNDSLRINASELRARVIGEGANLATTQLARIEFAENGGKINTDFLDNSGGVDSSDHEVNIKILLTDVMSSKTNAMDLASRNKLLEKMTEEVGDHVLRNNYQQSQAISLAEIQARDTLKLQEELIEELEQRHGLSRALEGLPDSKIIEQRLRMGKGMTRPELCILLAYSKIAFTQALLGTEVPDSPDMQPWLMNYFPVVLQKKYRKDITRHRLHREIIAMSVANSLINRMGPAFVKSCSKKTGAADDLIARAYIAAREVFGLRLFWKDIESLDNKTPAEVQLRAMREAARLAEHATIWFLMRLERDLEKPGALDLFTKGIRELEKNIENLLPEETRVKITQRAAAGAADGLPQPIARFIALVPVLESALDIIRISKDRKINLQDTARVYFALGERLHFDWLRQQARYLSAENYMQTEASSGLIDSLYSCQAGITLQIMDETGKGNTNKKSDITENWFRKHNERLASLERLFTELHAAGAADLPMLVIAEQRLRGLYGG
ncbi:MAG: NAD-glutamate dehydrogenase [Alphaproteobacteria bacterium]|nr:NAD-glutamate dehydrogenase [Alphaproteobacteria bacterium]